MSRSVQLPRPGRGQVAGRLREMLRVDHAGEMAAVQIYRAQKDVFRAAGRTDMAEDMARMESEEQVHLDRFNALMAERRVRPTAVQPVWNVAGFALGAATALMSERAAMACTEAVETEIDLHYGQQLKELGDDDPELAADIEQFQAEELEHRDVARDAGAAQAVGYPILTAAIRAGCRVAIGLSKRI